MLWRKVDSVVIPNFHFYWKHPIINKYLNTSDWYSPSEKYEGILILRKNKKPIWISHPFNVQQAKHTISGAIILSYSSKDDLKKIMKKNCGKRIGFDARHMAVSTLTSFKKLARGKKFVNVTKELEALREIKTKSEIEKITIAVNETQKVLRQVQNTLKPGISEKELEMRIMDEFKFHGFETAFCIVAFGKNTSNIHHVTSDKILEKDSPVMIDCGAKWKGYCADLTISFWVGENEPKQYTQAKNKVLGVITAVEGKLKAGLRAKKLFEETKPLGRMPHAIGHGLGLDVHDFPSGIGEKSNWKLKKGSVLAIEPAIYTKEFGIRIENTYEILNKGTKKL
jgi:Xaa-Pro aminopeptidase